MEIRVMMHDARVTRPATSGNYITFSDYGNGVVGWNSLRYSKLHDAFNVDDRGENADTEIEVDYWGELPDMTNAQPEAPDAFGADMAQVLTAVADGDAVAHMRRYSIDAPEEPDYNAYPVGE